jgi:HEAT repeat protein
MRTHRRFGPALLIMFIWGTYAFGDETSAPVKPAKEQLPYYLKQLKADDAAVRKKAAEDLGKIGLEAVVAIPALIEALDDPDAEVTVSAKWALTDVGEMAAPFLIAALENKSPQVRRLALEALPWLRGESRKPAIPAVVRLLRTHEDPDTRAAAVDAIRAFRAECAIPDLIDALVADRDHCVRYSVLTALLNFGPAAKAAVPTLTALMLNDSLEDRDSLAFLAWNTLASIGADAVPALVDVLRETNYPVQRRQMAVCALWRMAKWKSADVPKKAVPILIESLQEEDEHFRVQILDALEAMGKQAFAAHDVLSRLVKEAKSQRIRVVAARTLYSVDPTNDLSVPAIADGLKAKNPGVRCSAAYAAHSIGKPARAAVPALMQALQDEDVVVRREVAFALGAIGQGARAAVPALEKALKDTEASVRRAAGAALKQIEDDK